MPHLAGSLVDVVIGGCFFSFSLSMFEKGKRSFILDTLTDTWISGRKAAGIAKTRARNWKKEMMFTDSRMNILEYEKQQKQGTTSFSIIHL